LHDTTPRERRAATSPSVEQADKASPVELWRRWMPLSVRKRVPPSLATFARKHLVR
jgi:hypothetical protein